MVQEVKIKRILTKNDLTLKMAIKKNPILPKTTESDP